MLQDLPRLHYSYDGRLEKKKCWQLSGKHTVRNSVADPDPAVANDTDPDPTKTIENRK